MTADRDARIDRLCTEYLRAAEAGNPPDRAGWLEEHRDIAAELGDFLDCLEQVHSKVAPLRAVAESETTIDHYPRGSERGIASTMPVPAGYELLGRIAEGGMGVVYRAREVELNRVVALKMIRAGDLHGESTVQRFRMEVEATAGFDHPHIVPVYEVGVTEAGDPFFSMKFVEGRTLSDWLREGWGPDGALRTATGVRDAIRLLAAVTRAVHYAHQRGFLHRDLKPANVLLDAAGVPYVTDFGLAKRLTDSPGCLSLTQDGGLVGTLGYMAPEQARGEKSLTTAADVYALGAILFQMLTGRPLRPGRTLAEVSSHLGEDAPRPRSLNRDVDRDLEAICLKCLNHSPTGRFASADALADELDRWSQGRPIRTRPPRPTRRLWMWARRRPDVAALAGLSLLVVLTGVCLVTWKWQAELAARREVQSRASRSAATVARSLLEEGHEGDPESLGDATLWWVRSFQVAGQEDTGERAAARLNLAALTGRLHKLREIWAVPGATSKLTIAANGSRAAIIQGSDVILLDPRTGRETGTRFPHPGVQLVAFSPDGDTLATAGSDGVRVRDLRHPGAAYRVLQTPGDVRLLAISSGGTRVAVAGESSVSLYDDRVERRSLPCFAHSLAFDGAGSRLAAGCADGKARIWTITSVETEPAVFGPHDDVVRAVAFSPDVGGTRLLTGSDDHHARVWDIPTKKELVRLQHQDYVRAVAFSPDGRLAATGGSDSVVLVWEANTGRRVGQMLRHPSAVEVVSFAMNGAELITRDAQREARVWAVSPAARVDRTIPVLGTVYALAPLSDGKLLVGMKQGASLIEKGIPLPIESAFRIPEEEVWAIAVHPGGKWLAIGGRAGGEGWLSVADLADLEGRNHPRWSLPHPVRSMSFSPTAASLLVGTADSTTGGAWELDVTVPNAKMRALSNLSQGPVWAVAHSHDGRRYATSAEYGEVRVWQADTHPPLDPPPLRHPWRAVALTFSRDGERLLTASTDRQVRIWNVTNGRMLSATPVHRGAVWAMATSPDGRLFATAGRDECIRIWDAASGVPVGAPLRHSQSVWAVAFDRDGNLWSGDDDGHVRCWRAPDSAIPVPDALIEIWAEAMTGLRLDGDQVRILEPLEWQDRRDRLNAAGIVWIAE